MPCAHEWAHDVLCSFEDYKKNEKKEVKVDEILGADVARKAISDAMVNINIPMHDSVACMNNARPSRAGHVHALVS